jgi:hypothetical protein
VALALYVATVASIILGLRVDATYFVGFGEESEFLPYAEAVLGDVDVALPDGHDGQQFWILARDPLLLEGIVTAEPLDRPLYRAQRIGYPLLASPWRIGGERLLIWGLLVTNLVVVAVGTALAAGLGGTERRRYPSGLAFAASPLVWLAVLYDFSDALALAGLLGMLVGLRGRRTGWAVASVVVACLAKETSLLAVLAVAGIGRGLGRRERAGLVLAGILPLGVWRLYAMSRPSFGSDPEVREFSIVPFAGFIDAWRIGWSPQELWGDAAAAMLLVVLMALVAATWWRNRGSWELTGALPYALMLPFLSHHVVGISVNVVRAVGPALTLGALWYLGGRSSAEGRRGWGPILPTDGREAPPGRVDP